MDGIGLVWMGSSALEDIVLTTFFSLSAVFLDQRCVVYSRRNNALGLKGFLGTTSFGYVASRSPLCV